MNPGLLFLPASVLCSVTLAVLLKLARRHGVDVRQAILANYALASVLCLLLLRPDLGSLPHAPLLLTLAGLGVLLPTIFMALAQSVRHAGIVKTDAAQRLSLFIALGAAFVLFGEPVTARKLGGIALACAALFCLLRRPARQGAAAPHGPGRWWCGWAMA